MTPPTYVARLQLQIAIPYIQGNWEMSTKLVKIRADDFLFACIERPLRVERHGIWRTFPQWKVAYVEPGQVPTVGWYE